jgi:hypothetical protein
LNFYEQKGSKSMLLKAAATGENSGMHRAKLGNLDSAGEGQRAQRVSCSVLWSFTSNWAKKEVNFRDIFAH